MLDSQTLGNQPPAFLTPALHGKELEIRMRSLGPYGCLGVPEVRDVMLPYLP